MKIILLVSPVLLFSGCAVLQSAAEHAETVEELGQTATEIGTAALIINPQIGIMILTFGGVAVAVGQMLNLFKEQ